MKPLLITKKHNLRYAEVKHQQLKSNLSRQVIDDTFLAVTDTGYPIYYGSGKYNIEELREMLDNTNIPISKRHSGMNQRALVTNDVAPTRNKNDYASSSTFSRDFPDSQLLVNKYARMLNEEYRNVLPDYHKSHVEKTSEGGKYAILPDWKIAGTPFTSGIINKDTSLGCHLDSKNVKDGLSAMIVLSSGVRGGNLILPEYDLEFKLKDNSILIFNGGKIMHGVTPMQFEHEDSHRYSLVFYTSGGFCRCGTPKEELEKV